MFVSLYGGLSGLVHTSHLSIPEAAKPSEVYNLGQVGGRPSLSWTHATVSLIILSSPSLTPPAPTLRWSRSLSWLSSQPLAV